MSGLSFGNRASKNIYLCLHGWQDNCALYRPLLKNLPQGSGRLVVHFYTGNRIVKYQKSLKSFKKMYRSGDSLVQK